MARINETNWSTKVINLIKGSAKDIKKKISLKKDKERKGTVETKKGFVEKTLKMKQGKSSC